MGTNHAETTASAGTDYLTPEEVATKLNISVKSVYRIFGTLPGVLNLAGPGQRRRFLRIPRAVLEKYVLKHRVH